MASTAVKIDCTTCDTTGYENYWTKTKVDAYYRPGAIKRWNIEAGALTYEGDASIKVDPAHESLFRRATHLEFNGAKWSFNVHREPGAAMGQRRLVYSVTRKD